MLTLMVLFALQARPPEPLPYFDPLGRTPSTYEQSATPQTDERFQARVVCRSVTDGRYDRLVLVIVNSTLYGDLAPQFAT